MGGRHGRQAVSMGAVRQGAAAGHLSLRHGGGTGMQVKEAWLRCLTEVAAVCGRQPLVNQVLQVALTRSAVNETVASRILACVLLAILAPKLVRRGRGWGWSAAA